MPTEAEEIYDQTKRF